MCGNHALSSFSKGAGGGSPPRVREPPSVSTNQESSWRITPACAGTTVAYGTSRDPGEDHPRVCGNHSLSLWPYPKCAGSPPRVREPQSSAMIRFPVSGITPACAGTTNREVWVSAYVQDHPRVCGNHSPTS